MTEIILQPTGNVPTYASYAVFPEVALDGALAVALDTESVYIFQASTGTWLFTASGTISSVLSLGTLDSKPATATGGAVTGAVLTLQSASVTVPGLVNNTIQSFSGAKTFTSALNLSSQQIHAVADPTFLQDAATKNYVDTVASSLNPIQAVYAASTAHITGVYANGTSGVGATFTVTATGALTIDSVTPPIGSRVLLKDQSSGFQNGVYDVTEAGSVGVSPILTRSVDYNTSTSINAGDLTPVINGTLNTQTSYLQTATITAVGTDPLVFVLWTANPSSYLTKAANLSDVANPATAYANISNLWATYVPTITGFGTVTNAKGSFKQVGDSLFLKIYFVTGTVAASVASISLPGSFALSTDTTNKIPVSNLVGASGIKVGTYDSNSASGTDFGNWMGAVVTAPATSTTLIYCGLSITDRGNKLIPANGNQIAETGCVFSLECEVILA